MVVPLVKEALRSGESPGWIGEQIFKDLNFRYRVHPMGSVRPCDGCKQGAAMSLACSCWMSVTGRQTPAASLL